MKMIKLVLETGEEFLGESIGYDIDNIFSLGELVFNTSMTGYQEILSDPSYCDQIIVMTYPLIGNYGVNKDDFESLNPLQRLLTAIKTLLFSPIESKFAIILFLFALIIQGFSLYVCFLIFITFRHLPFLFFLPIIFKDRRVGC